MLNRLKDFSLYQQLILPMLIVGTIGVCATIYSAFVLENSVSALGDLYKAGDEKLRTLDDLETSVAYFRTLSLSHLASEKSSSMNEIKIELESIKKNIQIDIDLISTKYLDNHSQAIGKTRIFSNVIRQYFENVSKVLHLSADFEKELAFELWTQTEQKLWPEINNSMQYLKRHVFDEVSSTRGMLMSVASRNLLVTIAIGIGGGSLLLGIAFIVTRRITRRLSGLLAWSREVSAGNLSASLTDQSNDEVGRLSGAMSSMARNIQRAHNELAEAKNGAENVADSLRIYANAFENSGEAILISDSRNRILNVNVAFTRQTGFSREEVVGLDPRMLSSGKTDKLTYQKMWKALANEGFWQGELWDRKKSGAIYPKWAAISAIRDDNDQVMFYIASFTDISERKAADAQIEHLAHHDILTGLLNRFSLEERLEQSLAISRRDNKQVAVFFIDLDRFKNINDSLGHHIGDQLLVMVANRLNKCVRDSDVVARIGGDEFVVALPGINDSSHAAVIAENVRQQISKPYKIDKYTLETSPSIGISIYPNDGNTADDLMRSADIAMYHAKEQGRNNYYFFTESMLVAAHERLQLEHELRIALDNGQLELYYQPQISARGNKVCAMEALIRWRHPVKGVILPGKFIPIAEETGVILELGKWVIEEACRQLVEWKNRGVRDLRMAINLSVKQLQSTTLADDIRSVLNKYQVERDEIELEITETAAMNEPEFAVEQLSLLRELGVGLAIDDFGTGYSSLAYLKRLPIQTLKLDQTFVRDIESDPNDAEISAATIALAHNLGLEVVAEGVETHAQRDFLVAHNCDYLQGYLFTEPLPGKEASEFIQQRMPIDDLKKYSN